MPTCIWEVTRFLLYSGTRVCQTLQKNVQNSYLKNQYSPQITLADEHRIYKRYVTEEMKKGIVKQPKEIETHKNKNKRKQELMKQSTTSQYSVLFYWNEGTWLDPSSNSLCTACFPMLDGTNSAGDSKMCGYDTNIQPILLTLIRQSQIILIEVIQLTQ